MGIAVDQLTVRAADLLRLLAAQFRIRFCEGGFDLVQRGRVRHDEPGNPRSRSRGVDDVLVQAERGDRPFIKKLLINRPVVSVPEFEAMPGIARAARHSAASDRATNLPLMDRTSFINGSGHERPASAGCRMDAWIVAGCRSAEITTARCAAAGIVFVPAAFGELEPERTRNQLVVKA